MLHISTKTVDILNFKWIFFNFYSTYSSFFFQKKIFPHIAVTYQREDYFLSTLSILSSIKIKSVHMWKISDNLIMSLRNDQQVCSRKKNERSLTDQLELPLLLPRKRILSNLWMNFVVLHASEEVNFLPLVVSTHEFIAIEIQKLQCRIFGWHLRWDENCVNRTRDTKLTREEETLTENLKLISFVSCSRLSLDLFFTLN